MSAVALIERYQKRLTVSGTQARGYGREMGAGEIEKEAAFGDLIGERKRWRWQYSEHFGDFILHTFVAGCR